MNENIVLELKEEHKKIISFFNEIDATDILAEKKNFIKDLKKMLSEHLRKEDAIVYPVLLRSDDKEVLALGRGFLNSMVGYSKIFSDVVGRIMESSNHLYLETVKDYENIRDRIKDRMFVEEVALFPAYKREQSRE